ncbi:MAG: hypothetical protein CME62_02360 [Halobacteriovoraceae bacterium]|nr:hypothetical protein [Halobacteriovoraceae bacterium]|tara:strand:- start:19135 stop:20130 length:996 start_codon:yes stop_codon:yes gene_type:complete
MLRKVIISSAFLGLLLLFFTAPGFKNMVVSIFSPFLVSDSPDGPGKIIISIFLALIVFLFSYKNSVTLFQWIEDQTFGTRDYILKKCELLFFEIKPEYVTYILFFLAFGMSIITIGLFALLGFFKLGLLVGALVGFIGWKLPRPLMDFLVKRRINKLETQLVDALNLLANGLRAGRGLQQSMAMVVDELPPPVSQEFNLILQQTKIGVPINEAFDNFVMRCPTDDNNMFVSAINILRETGGNLAEVFDTIIDIIRERVRLKQKIAAFVAQGKFQALTMFMMPFVMAMFFGSSDPTFFEKMGHPIGITFIVVALLFDVAGLFVIWKIINIKV